LAGLGDRAHPSWFDSRGAAHNCLVQTLARLRAATHNTVMTTRPLIIDCDPGVDDALMLALAFGSPELDLLGVTVVGGNVPVELTSRNARILRQLAGREDVPVYAGCPGPMVREPVAAAEFHGASGLGSLEIFEPKGALADGHAVDFLIRTLKARRDVSILITGPMTNLATALVMAPEIAGAIRQIAAMGGAREAGGNITASAEFNIFADPHAADIVLRAGIPTLLVGLDATHQVRATKERIAQVRANGSAVALASAQLLDFSAGVERKIVGWESPPLHDPVPLAWMLNPQLVETKPATVRIETRGDFTLGHTAVEFRKNYVGGFNVDWAVKVDAQGVFDLIAERAGKSPGQGAMKGKP